MESEEAGASTSSPLPTDDDREAVAEPSASRSRSARQPGFLEKHGHDLIKGGLLLVFSAALTGIGWLAFSLNREVGEQKQTVTGVTKNVDEVRERVKRTEDRVESLSDSLHAKLDRLRDMVAAGQGAPPNQALQR